MQQTTVVFAHVVLGALYGTANYVRHDRTGVWHRVPHNPLFTFLADPTAPGFGWRLIPFQTLDAAGIPMDDLARSLMIHHSTHRITHITYNNQQTRSLQVGAKTYRVGDVIFAKLVKEAHRLPIPRVLVEEKAAAQLRVAPGLHPPPTAASHFALRPPMSSR